MPSNSWSWTSVFNAGQSALTTWMAGLIPGRRWLSLGEGWVPRLTRQTHLQRSLSWRVFYLELKSVSLGHAVPRSALCYDREQDEQFLFHQHLNWNHHHLHPTQQTISFPEHTVTFSSATSYVIIMITDIQLWLHFSWSVFPQKWCPDPTTSSRCGLAKSRGEGSTHLPCHGHIATVNQRLCEP